MRLTLLPILALFVGTFTSQAQTVELVEDLNTSGIFGVNNHRFDFNGELVFSGATSSSNFELMGYSGSNMYLIEEINMGAAASSPSNFVELNGKLYFFATETSTGRELWSYDGQNVELAYESVAGQNDLFATNEMLAFNGNIYFMMSDSILGEEMYSWDGTNSPVLVTDINSASGGSSAVEKLIVFNNELYFVATDSNDITEIWHYDGINAPIKATDSNFPNNNSFSDLEVFQNKLYFSFYDASQNINHYTIFSIDGINPSSLSPLMTGYSGLEPFDGTDFFVFNNELFFVATDSTINLFDTWKYDGFNVPTVAFQTYLDPIEYNGSLYFSMIDPVVGTEIFRYDGNNLPVLLSDYVPGTGSLVMNDPMLYDNKVFFHSGIAGTGVELFVLNCNTTDTIAEFACIQYVSPMGNVWDSTGIYYDTLLNVLGCDSVLVIDLVVSDVNVDVTVSGDTLFSESFGSTYQWIDCDSNVSIIGETNQSYIPTLSGNYALVVTGIDGCSDTSSCVIIDFLDAPSLVKIDLQFIPNPTSGVLKVTNSIELSLIRVFDSFGRLLLEKNQNLETIDLSEFATGQYMIHGTLQSGETVIERIIKE